MSLRVYAAMAVGKRTLGGATSIPGMVLMLVNKGMRPGSLAEQFRDEVAEIMSPEHDTEKVSKWDRTKGALQGMTASFQGWGKRRVESPTPPKRSKNNPSGTPVQVPSKAKTKIKYS